MYRKSKISCVFFILPSVLAIIVNGLNLMTPLKVQVQVIELLEPIGGGAKHAGNGFACE